jgi:hypothetical protein
MGIEMIKKKFAFLVSCLVFLCACQLSSFSMFDNGVKTSTPTILPSSTFTPIPTEVIIPTQAENNKTLTSCIDVSTLSTTRAVEWSDQYLVFPEGETDSVGMILGYSGKEINGVFFYAHQTEEYAIKGCLEEGSVVYLHVFNESGEEIAVIKGLYADIDKYGYILENAIWTEVLTKNDVALNFRIMSGTDEAWPYSHNEYSNAAARDDESINQAAQSFLQAVADGDKEGVADLLEKPMTVNLSDISIEIENQQDFLNIYDRIFTDDFKKLLSTAMPKHMFSRWSGIMLLDGQVWFNGEGKITSLSNYD